MSVCHSQHCFTFTEFDVCEIVFSAIWNLIDQKNEFDVLL